MREILFRGKRIDNGEWIEGYCARESNHACFAAELKYHHYIIKDIFMDFNLGGLQEFEVIPETVCEFTGLTDKNGVKIFEGDIVKAFLHNRTPFVFQITFRAGCFWYGNWNFIEFLDKFRNTEVIGNIYDNPEILKGDDKNE